MKNIFAIFFSVLAAGFFGGAIGILVNKNAAAVQSVAADTPSYQLRLGDSIVTMRQGLVYVRDGEISLWVVPSKDGLHAEIWANDVDGAGTDGLIDVRPKSEFPNLFPIKDFPL